MELPKLIIIVCCTYYAMASHYSHTIPVEGYETELQNLGQHVDIPETPVKVVKITKTIAVKIPVPYPVKVREKVPYPVHVAKPYPVPVPQIIKVPHIVSPKSGHVYESDQGGSQNLYQGNNQQGNSYSVEEANEPSDEGASYGTFPNGNSYSAGNSGYNQNLGSYGDEDSDSGSYGAPSNTYYQNSNNGFETKNYDQVLNQYLHNQIPGASVGGGNNGNYH